MLNYIRKIGIFLWFLSWKHSFVWNETEKLLWSWRYLFGICKHRKAASEISSWHLKPANIFFVQYYWNISAEKEIKISFFIQCNLAIVIISYRRVEIEIKFQTYVHLPLDSKLEKKNTLLQVAQVHWPRLAKFFANWFSFHFISQTLVNISLISHLFTHRSRDVFFY